MQVKTILTSVLVDDGDVFDFISLSRHHLCSLCHLARPSSRETLDLDLPYRRLLWCSFLFWGNVSEQVLARGTHRWSNVASAPLTMAALDDVV